MKYIIAAPDNQNGGDLKKILDGNKAMVFKGSFKTLKAAENYIREEATDIAFIRLGEAELNAVRLAGELREWNPLVKVIFVGNQRENAVDAFEYEADGFILMPFSKKKIGQLLQHNIGLEKNEID